MGFFKYNEIFDIDILKLETDYSKIRHDFDHMVQFLSCINDGRQFEVDVGLLYLTDAVKGKN